MYQLEKIALDKQITIDGEFIKFYKSIEIHQFLHKHHTFEIILDLETIEQKGAHTLEKSKAWLGKKLTTNISGKAFIGIVLDISMRHNKIGLNGEIIVKGLSQTVLLENGEQQKSWLKKDLKTVVSDIVIESDIQNKITPAFNAEIPYLCQYKESNYQYLQRLAHQYNEWFYFDGVNLIFGKPKAENKEPILLEYSSNITDLDITIKAFNPYLNSYTYNDLTDQYLKGEFKANNEGLNDLANTSLKASLQLYQNTSSFSISDPFLQDKFSLDDYLKKRSQSLSATSNLIIAKSTKKELQIGSVIKVSAADQKGFKDHLIKQYGEYIIIKISHFGDNEIDYRNEFVAIPASVKSLPINTNIKSSKASTQIAKVINNQDPENKGRVQVQFLWQKVNGEKTNFIRVMTPDAGMSDNVATNRGFVFIPEKDDQVMIGFEHDDPNRPFVMGSVFTGKTGSGGQEQNTIKSIITKSGNKVILNDKNGSITIADPSGNVVVMQGNGQIVIKAPNTLTLASNDINIMAGNSINLTAKPNKESENSGEGIINVTAKKSFNCSTEEESFNVISAKDVSIESKEAAISISGKTAIDLLSSDKMNLSGKEITSSAKKKNKVVGGKVEINKG